MPGFFYVDGFIGLEQNIEMLTHYTRSVAHPGRANALWRASMDDLMIQVVPVLTGFIDTFITWWLALAKVFKW